MKTRHSSLFTALVPAVLLALFVFVFAAGAGEASSEQTVREMPLNPKGQAFELNFDPEGHLWLSEYTAGEIWELDPAGRRTTIYKGLGHPGDARSDGAGTVWYTETSANYLGELSIATATVTLWEAVGSDGLFATQIDPAGNVWATDYFEALLFRFDPTNQEMCSYPIPSQAPSTYAVADAQGIWLADGDGEFIFRFDPALNEFRLWSLPSIGNPVGLDLDQEGNLWWADSELGTINRLEVQRNRLTTFEPPVTSKPVMLDASLSEVWFSDDSSGRIGRLLPEVAAGTPFTLTRRTVSVPPICRYVEPAATEPVTVTTGPMSFTRTRYAVSIDSEGWAIMDVPQQGAPYGIRLSGADTWVVDYARRVLARIPFGQSESYQAFLPVVIR